jgi:glucokinase
VSVGVGVAGQVDAATGQVLYAPNLEWHEVPLRYQLHKALGLQTLVVNDVRAATYGEWAYGAGHQTEHMICIFVGTGVGGGVVARGQVLDGCSNTAGEFGHATIVAGGRPCRCSNIGCLEAYVGGWAIARRAQEASNRIQQRAQ